ncbi:MAG: 50S ribosomal protein L13 [Candidatus Marinimicrobia bacterium]|nr:50S ribosomal protein L13 [Candidatus Neomarinimicrobiota bacterium]MDD5581804.1 50S ribosomal protein L13 [Candidatus Neomarinimicrobiota bacterium]
MKTYTAKLSDIEQKWYIIDATDMVLGRLSSEVAQLLRGKHKPTFTPHLDMGDYVIIVNAEKVRVTGNKASYKQYFHHTGYPGGTRFKSYKDLQATNPEAVILHAVKGMLPHNRLGRQLIKKLKVYRGPEHPHAAQKPETLNFKRS